MGTRTILLNYFKNRVDGFYVKFAVDTKLGIRLTFRTTVASEQIVRLDSKVMSFSAEKCKLLDSRRKNVGHIYKMVNSWFANTISGKDLGVIIDYSLNMASCVR